MKNAYTRTIESKVFEVQIVRSEVVSPLSDAVGLVDYEVGYEVASRKRVQDSERSFDLQNLQK